MNPHLLRTPHPGDPLSAEQGALITQLLRRTFTGAGVMQTSRGWTITQRPSTPVAAQRLVRITAVLSDRLRCQEVRMIDWREWQNVGEIFDAAAWPSQELSDYEGADQIIMKAEKYGTYWVVQLMGDRLHAVYPDAFCEACA